MKLRRMLPINQFYFKFCLFIISLFFLSSCSSKKNTLFYWNQKNDHQESVKILKQGGGISKKTGYQQILPGDLLSIRNLQNETQILGYTSGTGISTSVSTDYLVEADSTVALPILNKVKLGGLYLPDAENLLNKKYSESLLKEPLITIKITNQKVTLLGEFTKVGNIPLLPNKSYLTEIIAEAGGLNKRANPKTIKIIRGNLKDPRVIIVNLQHLEALANENLYLQNNDIIYAETKNSYKALDQITSARTLISISASILSAYLLIDRLNK